jgi:hypothetical protein
MVLPPAWRNISNPGALPPEDLYALGWRRYRLVAAPAGSAPPGSSFTISAEEVVETRVDPAPVPYVPLSVTNAQARAILLSTPAPGGGSLFDVVDAALRADTSLEGRIGLAFWEYANQIDRNGALVTRLGAVLGLTSAQIDAMFIQASGLAA